MSLEKYKARRKEWIVWLYEDRHSIMPQIVDIVRKSIVIRIVTKGIELAPKDSNNHSKLNGLIWNTLTSQLMKSQAIAIRRLIEDYCPERHPKKKEVYSLKRLLEDMKFHAHLITRENIFAVDGVPQNLAEVRRQYDKYICNQQDGVAYNVPKEVNIRRAEEKHRFFDKIVGVTEESRSKDDCIKKHTIDGLIRQLSKCKPIGIHVNKMIVHASSPFSRQEIDLDSINLTFGHLKEAEKSVCHVALLAEKLVGKTTTDIIPRYLGDQFLYIDNPLVRTEDVAEISRTWQDFAEETSEWYEWDGDWLNRICNQ